MILFLFSILNIYSSYPGPQEQIPIVGSLFANQNMPVRGLNLKKSPKH